MHLYLRKLAPLVAFIAGVALGCDKPESPGEPESKSAMADQDVRADFDGKLEVEVNAVEAAGEYSNIEVVFENISDKPVTVAKKDYQFAADSSDWFAAREAPAELTIEPTATETTTVSVALPVAQLNLMNVGNIRVKLPETTGDTGGLKEAPQPTGNGVHRLEIPDNERAD